MTTSPPRPEPGARWLRRDLHVHTPFDREKKFGENIRAAIDALKKERPQRLAEVADRFVQACRKAADGAGLDLVALTDHNSIDGYDRVRKGDLPDDDASNVRWALLSILASKRKRDFGHTKGTLLADHEITLDVVVAERVYRVRRTASGLQVTQDPDRPGAQSAALDVRSLLVPRVLSQRQIPRIAPTPPHTAASSTPWSSPIGCATSRTGAERLPTTWRNFT